MSSTAKSEQKKLKMEFSDMPKTNLKKTARPKKPKTKASK
jgi:hypothetical protein